MYCDFKMIARLMGIIQLSISKKWLWNSYENGA